MRNHILLLLSSLILICFTSNLYAQDEDQPTFGQTIQITTRLYEWLGKPSWLLMIRDLDHNENIPYLFDFRKGSNFWIALTYSRHYLITASTLKIETYDARRNKFKMYKINNFCHLESHGRVIRGESMKVLLEGELTNDPSRFDCQVIRFPEADFTIVPLDGT